MLKWWQLERNRSNQAHCYSAHQYWKIHTFDFTYLNSTSSRFVTKTARMEF